MRGELRQLRALLADLEVCRKTLREAVGSLEREITAASLRRRARRRRTASVVGLVVLFSIGAALAGTSSFGAQSSDCAPGSATVKDASISIAGNTVVAQFSVAAGCTGVSVSLAAYEAPSVAFALPQTLFASAGATFESGGPYTLSTRIPDCFFQVDLVTGSVLPELDAANLYGGRKAAFTQGGNTSCSPSPPPTTTTTTTTAPTTTAVTTATTSTATTTAQTPIAPTTTAAPPATTTTAPTTTAPFQPPQTVDVAVVKQASRHKARVGDLITYTLTVTNSGSAPAVAVTLIDPLPAQEKFVSTSDPSCSGGSVVECVLGTLEPGASRTITVVTLARTPGTATNVATVTTTSTETNTQNNQSHTTVVIRAPFRPPPICAQVSLRKRVLFTAHRTTLVAVVRHAGKPLAGARVEIRGAGIFKVERTDARGNAHFSLKPRLAGMLSIRVLQSPFCPAARTYLLVQEQFRPPSFTG